MARDYAPSNQCWRERFDVVSPSDTTQYAYAICAGHCDEEDTACRKCGKRPDDEDTIYYAEDIAESLDGDSLDGYYCERCLLAIGERLAEEAARYATEKCTLIRTPSAPALVRTSAGACWMYSDVLGHW